MIPLSAAICIACVSAVLAAIGTANFCAIRSQRREDELTASYHAGHVRHVESLLRRQERK